MRGNQWGVSRVGNMRVTRRIETKEEVRKFARELAIDRGCVVFVHGSDLLIHDCEP